MGVEFFLWFWRLHRQYRKQKRREPPTPNAPVKLSRDHPQNFDALEDALPSQQWGWLQLLDTPFALGK